jgi:hypothetical protein
MVALTTLVVLLAGCGSSSPFSARMRSWSPVDGRIVVEYRVHNDSRTRARIGCILTATVGAGNSMSNFVVSDMVEPGRSVRLVGFLPILDHDASHVHDVTVRNCSRAADDYQQAPQAAG